MKEGEMAVVEYTGRTDGEVFDTSRKDVAQENDLDRDEEFKPVPVLIGENYVIEGFEDAVEEMNVGDSKQGIEIPPGKGYGHRDSDDVEVYPESEFSQQGIQNISRGDEIMVGQRRGRVVSAQSGRVRIDFNHPLAGQELTYDIEVVDLVDEDEEKAKNIIDYRMGHGSVSFNGDTVVLDHSHDHPIPNKIVEKIEQEIQDYTEFEELEVKS
jgi:FKBP-type peptidyl-prolyl cis-trans isomerase SlyD